MASWYEGWFGASWPCFAGRLLSTEVLRSISLRTEQDAGGESWEQGNSQQGASQEQGRSVHHQGFRVMGHYRQGERDPVPPHRLAQAAAAAPPGRRCVPGGCSGGSALCSGWENSKAQPKFIVEM